MISLGKFGSGGSKEEYGYLLHMFGPQITMRLIESDGAYPLKLNISFLVKHLGLFAGEPDFALFASRINTKCQRFASWCLDPDAFIIDAFTFKWKGYIFYAFPPFSLILHALQKIIIDRAEVVLVVPLWKNLPWYPLYISLLKSKLIIFPPDSNMLFSIQRVGHPLATNLTLVAGLLSGALFN